MPTLLMSEKVVWCIFTGFLGPMPLQFLLQEFELANHIAESMFYSYVITTVQSVHSRLVFLETALI